MFLFVDSSFNLINNARNTSIFDAVPFHIHLLLKDLMSLLQICCNSFESYKNWKTHLLCCLNQMDRSDLILVCFLLLCIDFKKISIFTKLFSIIVEKYLETIKVLWGFRYSLQLYVLLLNPKSKKSLIVLAQTLQLCKLWQRRN